MTMVERRRLALAVSVALTWWVAPGAVPAQPLPTADPAALGFDPDRLARLDAALERAVEAESFPGAVVMVARDGRLVHEGVYGRLDPDRNAAMPADAIFRIYSMTKPLVSVAAMMLVEEGRLQLTDPVAAHLPAFAEATVSEPTGGDDGVTYAERPAARAMTVQDLLRHTSGLAYGEITGNAVVQEGYEAAGAFQPGVIPFDSRGPSPEAQVEALGEVPLVHDPATTWEYGLSSDVLGRVVEAVAGQRLEDFLAARLFEPLGMTDSGFVVAADDTARLAEPFATDPASGEPIVVLDVAEPPGNASGGAGGVSTAADYLRFTQMLLNGGELDGTRILSPNTVQLMTSDHLGAHIEEAVEPGELLLGVKGYTFGLGFAVREGDGIAGVAGTAGDYTWAGYAGTYFWADPATEVAAVFMTQAPSPERAFYRRLVRNLVYQAIVE